MRYACRRNAAALLHLIFVTTFLLVLTEAARADRECESGFSITISEVRSLNLDSESTYLTPYATAVLTGWTEQCTLDVNVSANVDWVLRIRGTNPIWEGPWPKPVGDICFAYGGSEYVPLDTTPIEVCRGGPADRETYPINFMITLDPLRDIPGEYYYNHIVLELEAP